MTPDVRLYHPACALVVFTTQGTISPYIEYYDMDETGCPVNPHPLSVREAQNLAKALDTSTASAKAFLKPEGIIPSPVLHINPSENGSMVWYTKPQTRTLHFAENLNLWSGAIALPALVWKADKKQLSLYALKGRAKPKKTTTLYHAPFFNLYRNGTVCMGSVNVHIREEASLEAFIKAWQGYFFDSYFSHLIDGNNPVKGNLLSLYKDLMEKSAPFPTDCLVKSSLTLKDLL